MHPHQLHLHERPLTSIKFNYDGDFFLTAGKDGDVCLVRTETCERIGTYHPQGDKAGAVFAVDVTLDSKYVVTASADGKLAFYKFEGDFIHSLPHGGILKCVEWNQKPGEQNLVVTCNDKFKDGNSSQPTPNRIMVWQFEPVKKMLTIDAELPMKASKVKWGPFDETLVSIFDEGYIIIWDAVKGDKIKQIDAHKGSITNMNFSPDRMLMITASKDQTAKLWAMDDEYELVKTYETDRPLNDAAISPLYDPKEPETSPKYHILMGGGQDAKDVTTTGASSGKFEALLWNMVYAEEIGTIKGHFGPMNALAWRRDGKGFVTGGEDGFVRVFTFDNEYFTSKKFD